MDQCPATLIIDILKHGSFRCDCLFDSKPANKEVSSWTLAQQPYFAGDRALDFACGTGRHTLWLAGLGYHVDAVDISMVALRHLSRSAEEQVLSHSIRLIQADLTEWRPEKTTYDLIFVTRYLDRTAIPALVAALKPDGLLLYRTFHTDLLRLHWRHT